jgi:hypothetical protein
MGEVESDKGHMMTRQISPTPHFPGQLFQDFQRSFVDMREDIRATDDSSASKLNPDESMDECDRRCFAAAASSSWTKIRASHINQSITYPELNVKDSALNLVLGRRMLARLWLQW